MSRPNFRHELKHFISYVDYLELKAKLSIVLHRDINANEDGKYKVTSVYMDNYNDKALRQKCNGLARREKFRIRFYENDLSLIKLEKKSKVKNLCLKESALITKLEFEKILNNDFKFLIKRDENICRELYSKMIFENLRAKNITTYTREAYAYHMGNVRITFDYDIRANNNIGSFFDNIDATEGFSIAPDYIILEVKYDNYLPQFIVDIIQFGNRRISTFSKYAATRMF